MEFSKFVLGFDDVLVRRCMEWRKGKTKTHLLSGNGLGNTGAVEFWILKWMMSRYSAFVAREDLRQLK